MKNQDPESFYAEPSKTLEDIQQELDEKFEYLIDKVQNDKCTSYKWRQALRKYEAFCNRQDAHFEFLKKYPGVPLEVNTGVTLDINAVDVKNLIISSGIGYFIGAAPDRVGYYTFGNSHFQIYMSTKPNSIKRWFMKNCLDFRWTSIVTEIEKD